MSINVIIRHNNKQHKMKRTIVSLCILLTSSVFASDQKAISRSEYVENWKSVAIEQMLNIDPDFLSIMFLTRVLVR